MFAIHIQFRDFCMEMAAEKYVDAGGDTYTCTYKTEIAAIVVHKPPAICMTYTVLYVYLLCTST